DLTDQFYLFLILRWARHDRFDHLHAATQHAHATVGTMGQGIHQLMIDPRHLVQTLRHLEDLCEGLYREDRSLFDLQHQHEGVGTTEGRGVLVMHFDEGMILRQEFIEACLETQAEREAGKDEREDRHPNQDRLALINNSSTELIEVRFLCFAHG